MEKKRTPSNEKNQKEQKEANVELEEKSRFLMTKKHHKETYEEAKKMGRMDEDFIPLCDFIVTTKNYFTTSSCAGRICLIGLENEEKKQESAFYRKWHRTVKSKEIIDAVKEYKGKMLYFKQEPIIFHLGTNTLENAKNVLVLCEKTGIKRAGIKVAKGGKFIIEMVGTQNITAPIKEGKMMADKKYLTYLVKKGNEKFVKNQELINKLTIEAKKILK